MAFGGTDGRYSRTPMSEINMVPFIDVVLVLLVILLVTAPLLSHSVHVELPGASAQPTPHTLDKIELSIRANGDLYWNDTVIDRREMQRRFAEESRSHPQPAVHSMADKRVEYRFVAETLADANQAGLSRIGFISIPDK
ncbi:MAG: biopolymer transporter ExbD [Burkholderiaceae bacterium]|jgi:biopolymer transport protein ExbD|nr:biopolymer transporter ExbD [Burkholderiaceae bacterium]